MSYLIDLNRDQDRRNTIVFGSPEQKQDIVWFKGLSLENLAQLILENFVDLSFWNGAPSASILCDWAIAYRSLAKEITFDGYVVGLERDDYRMTIEAIAATGCETEFVQAFDAAWGEDHYDPEYDTDGEGWAAADSFTATADRCYAWWD